MTRIFCDECGEDMTNELSAISILCPSIGSIILRKPNRDLDYVHICWDCVRIQLSTYLDSGLMTNE